MALTTIIIPITAQSPQTIGELACGTSATQGFTFRLSDLASMAKVVNITGDADWFWSHLDAVAAVTSANRVRADQPFRVQVHTPVTIYCRTATGTSNLWVTVEV